MKTLFGILCFFMALSVCFGAVGEFDTRLNLILEDNTVAIYVGREDGLNVGETYALFSDGIEAGRIELVKVEEFYTTGKILTAAGSLRAGEIYTFRLVSTGLAGGSESAGFEPADQAQPAAVESGSGLELDLSRDLSKIITLRAGDVPMNRLLEGFRDEGVDVFVDPYLAEELNDINVTYSMKDRALKSGLLDILETYGLTYLIEGESFHVISEDDYEYDEGPYEYLKVQLNYADAVTVRDIILSMNLQPPPEEVFAYTGPVNPAVANTLDIGGYREADSRRWLPNEQIVTAKRDFLLIKAAPDVIEEIEEIIALVDVAPRQVIVKALVLELNRSNIDDYGADFLLFPSFGRYGVSMFTGDMDDGQYWVGVASRKVLGERMKTFWAFLHDQLLRRKAKLLNNPTISTIDGHPALIQVGKEIPIRTSTTSVNEGTLFSESQVDYRHVGMSLYVVPRVDERRGEISLLIHPVLSELEEEFKKHYKTGKKGGLLGIIDTVLGTGGGSTESDGGGYPNIIVRETNSIVRLKSGEEVVLGGLIRREKKTRVKKMPLLGDLPVLGNVFSRRADYIDEQELLIILVPFLVDELPSDSEIESPLYNLLYRNFHEIDDRNRHHWKQGKDEIDY